MWQMPVGFVGTSTDVAATKWEWKKSLQLGPSPVQMLLIKPCQIQLGLLYSILYILLVASAPTTILNGLIAIVLPCSTSVAITVRFLLIISWW